MATKTVAAAEKRRRNGTGVGGWRADSPEQDRQANRFGGTAKDWCYIVRDGTLYLGAVRERCRVESSCIHILS